MRQTGFLRTPIRADHQNLMQNLVVAEQPLTGNPSPSNAYPQTLVISFDTTATEVQIALLWEGMLYFLPDDTNNLPEKSSDVTEANFANWSLVGDLVLHTEGISFRRLDEAFNTHIPFIQPAPSSVRYSKVRLTKDFLFTTLQKMPLVRFAYKGATVDKTDPEWHAKFVHGFVRGQAGIWCPIHSNDPTQDFTQNPMPSVNLQAPGTSVVLHVAIATRVAEAMDFSWFIQRPEYDGISGENLVDPAVNTAFHQRFNPAHPSHSVISAMALFQNAASVAYANDHDAAKPLRALLSAPRIDGRTYRRIDLVRPPIPATNSVTTSNPSRPFPMYRLAWKVGGSLESLRIPLTGRLYLPLVDGDYTFWAIPRSQDPNIVSSGSQLQLSIKVSTRKYIDLPSSTVNISFATADKTKTIYAHLLDYDSKRAWAVLQGLGNEVNNYKAAAEARWNVEVLNLWIYRSSAMAPYSRLYGYIRASAGRHGLAPEFLHAIFMGEGVGSPAGLIEQNRTNGVAYAEGQIIDGFIDLGLDDIQDTLANLIANSYLDSSFSGVLTNRRTVPNELGEMKNTADITGWGAAIELIAAELHSRLDQMLKFCTTNGIHVTTEEQHRYLSYIRYNTGVATSQNHATNLHTRLAKWTGPRPTDQMNGRYNTLQRIAIAEWYEAAEVYR